MLKSKKFQNKVKAVDSSDDRHLELKKARIDPEFDKMIEDILEELGCSTKTRNKT